MGDYTLLLPNYIGSSANEGSGIFDPVVETGVKYAFYPLDKKLNIDFDSFRSILGSHHGNVAVLLVHYFGYIDPSIDEIIALCRNHNAIVIEDAAHALYTDFIDHKCGDYGDFTIYSLHKMLPVPSGGMLKVNANGYEFDSSVPYDKYAPFDYNFYDIAQIRKQNAAKWYELLSAHPEHFDIIRTNSKDVTPQTYPVILKTFDRNEMYFRLNEAGFGAVSLYHTMIEPLRVETNDSFWSSKRIINMPVHQDASVTEIEKMFRKMMELIRS